MNLLNVERRLIEPSLYEMLPDELKILTDNFEGREKDVILVSCLTVLSNCLPNLF